MAKLIGFIRRRDDLAFAAFSRHWRTTHRDHALALRPWLKGYVQNHLRPGPIARMQRPADGCPTLWVDRLGDMAELAASEAFSTGAGPDELRFMEGRSSGLPVEEQVVIAPAPGAAIKLMLFLGAKPGTAIDAAAPAWPTARASGHVRNLSLARDGLDPAYCFDVVEEIWWADVASYEADRADAIDFSRSPWIDPARTKAALVEELVVIPPPR